ncbi:MAG: stage III sporulation protein AF [Lachnospiraceae bacterium]|nr:stage III sporulation protein AF [Lachnospiraceae bacterium]
MGESLLQVIKGVGIFVVCAQMLLHFKPSETYGKYIRLLISIMVLAQFISPIMGIFGRGSTQSFGERVIWYDEMLRQGTEDADRTEDRAQTLLEQMTLEEIKSRIDSQNMGEEEAKEDMEEAEKESGGEVLTGTAAVETAGSERLVERIEVKLND